MEKLSPTRVILDATARIATDTNLVMSAREVPLLLIVGPQAPEAQKAALAEAGVRMLEVPVAPGGLDIKAALEALAKEGHARVLVEGGAEVASSLVNADLVDEVVILRAPVVVGPNGVRALGGTALSAIERSPRYRLVETAGVGPDTMRTYVRV
jgi:diaminohydroxyphosphoribosylaminopyrimidine deaminase/5-amino-6-(5-phosphoribosylamino)uracil reductase